MKLERVDDSNFADFLGGEGIVYLFLGNEGCGPCMEWTLALEAAGEVGGLSRVGKVTLGGGGLTNFKRVHSAWLSTVREMPYSSLWRGGVLAKEWPGGGLDRLVARVGRLVAGE